MPISHTVVPGDTYDTIARKRLGDDQQSGRIRQANPGAVEPLSPGTSITIPDDTQTSARGAGDGNEVALSVGGKRFRFWESVTITLSIDAVPTAEFTAPFEPDDETFRETFRPFSFKRVDIDIGPDRLFTGTLVTPTPTQSATARTVTASCYALPGVLGDCTAPASAYPIEWNAATLRTIAERVAGFFGLGVVFDADAGPVFERVGLNCGVTLMTGLAKLAAQRGLVISATRGGDLLFTKSVTSGPVVAELREGESPVISVTPQFNAQRFYSDVTGVTPTLVGLEGPQHTEKNPHLRGAVRPHTFTSDNAAGADIAESVRGKIGRMFGAVVSYDVPVATWRDPSGALWAPNTLITLDARGAMIYGASTFLIRSVILEKTSGAENATLNIVLPGAFAGQVPERMPWDE